VAVVLQEIENPAGHGGVLDPIVEGERDDVRTRMGIVSSRGDEAMHRIEGLIAA